MIYHFLLGKTLSFIILNDEVFVCLQWRLHLQWRLCLNEVFMVLTVTPSLGHARTDHLGSGWRMAHELLMIPYGNQESSYPKNHPNAGHSDSPLRRCIGQAVHSTWASEVSQNGRTDQIWWMNGKLWWSISIFCKNETCYRDLNMILPWLLMCVWTKNVQEKTPNHKVAPPKPLFIKEGGCWTVANKFKSFFESNYTHHLTNPESQELRFFLST